MPLLSYSIQSAEFLQKPAVMSAEMLLQLLSLLNQAALHSATSSLKDDSSPEHNVL